MEPVYSYYIYFIQDEFHHVEITYSCTLAYNRIDRDDVVLIKLTKQPEQFYISNWLRYDDWLVKWREKCE